MTKFTTADGITFHLVGGEWVDNLNPAKVDLTFDFEGGLIEFLTGMNPEDADDIETYVTGVDDAPAYFRKMADQRELLVDFAEFVRDNRTRS